MGASWGSFGGSERSLGAVLGPMAQKRGGPKLVSPHREPQSGLLGRSWGALGPLLGALGAVLGASWAPLGALLGASWGSFGGSERSLGAVLGPMAQKRGGPKLVSPHREPQSGLLGRSWGALGPLLGALGAVLGASWAPLGALLGHLGAILMAQERIGSEEAGRPKSLIFPRFWKDFGLLGGSRGGSESTWGRLVALLEPLGGMSEAILHHLRLYWAILEAILEHLRPSWGHLGPKRAV